MWRHSDRQRRVRPFARPGKRRGLLAWHAYRSAGGCPIALGDRVGLISEAFILAARKAVQGTTGREGRAPKGVARPFGLRLLKIGVNMIPGRQVDNGRIVY